MTSPIDHDDGLAIENVPPAGEAEAGTGMHVKLSIVDLLQFTDETNTLYVYGDAGDSLDAGDGWVAAGRESIEGSEFNIYVQGGVTLQVDCDIDQSLIGIV